MVYVYVDPFWEVIEVERVLSALRSECGVDDPIKYKADGVSHLNLSKDNAFGIPPSLYSAAREVRALPDVSPCRSHLLLILCEAFLPPRHVPAARYCWSVLLPHLPKW